MAKGARVRKPTAKLVLALIVILFAVAVYLPTLKNESLGWDDDFTITNNPLFVRLSVGNVTKLFSRFYRYDYYPVFYASLWLDYLFWGASPTGYYSFNLLLHAANALLVFLLGVRILRPTGYTLPAAAAAALIFAVHPVNVEPVAWATGRKVLLAAFFVLLSVHSYLDRSGRPARAALALLFFLAGCLSNIYAVVGLFYLVALDTILQGEKLSGSLRKKWPFFLIAAGTVVLKIAARRGEAYVYPFSFWFGPEWFYTLITNYGRNLLSLALPVRLSARYVSRPVLFPWTPGFIAGLTLLCLTAALIRKARNKPGVLFPVFWFLLGLLPLLHLIRHHIFRADRFLYLPGIGVFLLFGSALDSLHRKTGRLRKTVSASAFFLLLCFFLILTESRVTVWRNEKVLWTDAVLKDPANVIALNNLGVSFLREGRTGEADRCFRNALRLNPQLPETRLNLGITLAERGEKALAEKQYRFALRLEPALAKAHYKLAELLADRERWEDAAVEFRETLRLRPGDDGARAGLGKVLEERGGPARAVGYYREVLARDPESWIVLNELALVLLRQGRLTEAATHLHQALELNPVFAEAYNNLGNTWRRRGEPARAVTCFRKALEIRPNFAEAYSNLGGVLSELGSGREARENFEKALKANPLSAGVHNNIGNSYFKEGRFEEAIPHYRKSLELQPDFSEPSSNLAVALISLGKYEEATGLLRLRLLRDPQDLRAVSNLARLLATCPDRNFRNGAEAVNLAELLCRRTDYRDPIALETLAAAYAEAGRFEDAARTSEKALESAREAESKR